MLLREDAVTEHMAWAWLQCLLRQEPGCKLGSGLPDHRVQTGIETRELRAESHEAYSAIDVCQRSYLLAVALNKLGQRVGTSRARYPRSWASITAAELEMRGVKGAGISTLLTADTSALDEDLGKVHGRRPHPGGKAGILRRILRFQPRFTYTHISIKQLRACAYASRSGPRLVDASNLDGELTVRL